MRHASIALAFLGALAAASCVIPSFDVEPASTSRGGSSTSGAASGGKAGSATGGKGGATAGNSTAGSETSPGGADTSPGGTGNTVAGPVFVGHSVFSDSATGSDHSSGSKADATFEKPEGTAIGDFMLVFFGCDHGLQNLGIDELADRGWTLIDQHTEQGEDGQGTYVLYRVVDGTEPDPIVFANINDLQYPNGVQGLLSVYRGVSVAMPINAYETTLVEVGSEASKDVVSPTPPITTTVDGCLLIVGLSPDSQIDAPIITMWPEGFDENQTSVTNPKAPYPFGWANIYAAERHFPSAGSIGGSTFGWRMTYGGMHYDGSLTFILALAPE